MASRHSAARPRRAGEAFARTHHGDRGSDDDQGSAPSKKVKFDVRNPSALAADAREDDDVLDADVIGVGGGLATKRGAVNIDGYDSDSDNDTFRARADAKSSRSGDREVNILDQLDNYDSRLKGGEPASAVDKDDGEEDDDMFAEEAPESGAATAPAAKRGRKDKEVRFLDNSAIEGEEHTSKSGGHVRLDDGDSSDDDEDVELAIEEEGIDEEVGAGGRKHHAPKIDAFNMKQEHEEGRFDEAGNFIRKAADADDVHDRWLDGLKKKDMKKAAAAHEKREAEMRQLRKEEDSIITSDLIKALILELERGETPLEALARLGKAQTKSKTKKVPKWKLKKQNNGADSMAVDSDKVEEDPQQQRVRASIGAITDAADRLLGRDYQEIYDTEREMLVREYRNETGEDWVDPPRPSDVETEDGKETEGDRADHWEYRWTDGRDGGSTQGPFDSDMMKAWHGAGYFGEGVEFRRVGGADDGWSRVPPFL